MSARMWRKENPCALLEVKWVQPPWKTVWRFLKKLIIELPYDPAIPLLSINPKEIKIESQRDISTPLFIAALFTAAKIWKQPKCPSTDEWITKMWQIYTMEYYSAMRKKDIHCLQQHSGP